MFKFVIFVASVAYVSAGIIPAEHHELHHHGLTFPSGHGTIVEHSHLLHAPIAKVASHHSLPIYSHPHYAVAAAPTVVKVTSPVIKYVSQPIVKIAAPEPSIIYKSHYPHELHHEHLPKVTYKLAGPIVAANHHHQHHGHALTLPAAIHTSPIVLSAGPAYHHHHHASLPLASHHGHHEILH